MAKRGKRIPRNKNIPGPGHHQFDPNNYRSGSIYPLGNPLRRGYGVDVFNRDPSDLKPSARFINVKGETLDFWIEEIEAKFDMAGTTAQSQKVRQFFPHNMVQPSVTIRGRAPNSYQFNRLAAFVRVGQFEGLSGRELRALGVPVRNVTDRQGRSVVIPTLRLIIRNGSGDAALAGEKYPFSGRTVKGRHQAWKLEGYVKAFKAGAQRFDPAPSFEFEYLIAESQGPSQDQPNVGIWSDTAVAGDDIRPWADIFRDKGKKGFVHFHTSGDKSSSSNDGSDDTGPWGDSTDLPGTRP